jgi:hypothetical protein
MVVVRGKEKVGSGGLLAARARTARLRFAVDEDLGCLVLDAGGGGLGLYLDFFFFLFILAALVFGDAVENVVGENAQDQVQPEEVDGLQTGQQGKCNILTDPALVLLGLPVQLEGSNGAELGKDGPEDLQVQVVAEVNPHADERAEVGNCDPRI